MKEITRIHIAKVSYDAELEAKKELEVYLKALEAYSDDADIMSDIEIRITEILAERGIKKGGVIAKDDIDALKNQLGEPRDFMGEGDIAVGDIEAEVAEDVSGRKLFRDTDRAVVGGVLAGIAAFFKVNPALIRILFIIVALASFGTALLVYVVLWIAVPAAKTAADKLQMAGRPVTISSIREMNESDAGKSPTGSGQPRRVLLTWLGVLSVIGAAGAAMATVTAILAVVFGGPYVFESEMADSYLLSAFIFAVASGTLLTVLFILTAYASFVQKMTRRVLISICVVILAGLVTFTLAIGLAKYGSYTHQGFIERNTRTQTVELPSEVRGVSSLVIDTHGVDVNYTATDGEPRAELRAVAREASDMPRVQVEADGSVLKITSDHKSEDTCGRRLAWCLVDTPVLEIYAPALTNLTAENDSAVSYHASSQGNLAVVAKDDTSVNVLQGVIKNVTVEEGVDSNVSFSQATVDTLNIRSMGKSSVLDAGTIRSLAVHDGGSCPGGPLSSRVSVWKVTSGTMTVNDQKESARSLETGCTDISIEGENVRD